MVFALAHTGSGGCENRADFTGCEGDVWTGRGREGARDGRVWGDFKLLPGMSRREGEHRIGDMEDSVQSSRQVPQNSGRRSERAAMTEGHRTGKDSRIRHVRGCGDGLSGSGGDWNLAGSETS